MPKSPAIRKQLVRRARATTSPWRNRHDVRQQHRTDGLREQLGSLLARSIKELGTAAITEAEFRVFSQFGEDGLIQFLVQRVPVERDLFVELGVQDYRESNTRFLLVHNNWRGLVVDDGTTHEEFITQSGLRWRHQVDAVTSFITAENINALLSDAGVTGDIGLLSIDIDGNDIWIFDALDVVQPRIVIVEYNSVFGPHAAVAVPYDAAFMRARAHESNLYYGASLAAITRIASAKGYALVGGNSTGHNALFVRRDVLAGVPERRVLEVWRPSRFREDRALGELVYTSSHADRLARIAEMPLVNVDSGRLASVADAIPKHGTAS